MMFMNLKFSERLFQKNYGGYKMLKEKKQW